MTTEHIPADPNPGCSVCGGYIDGSGHCVPCDLESLQEDTEGRTEMSNPPLGIVETTSQIVSELMKLVKDGLVIQGELIDRVSKLEQELKEMKNKALKEQDAHADSRT